MKCFVNSTTPSYYCFYFWRNTAHHPMGISDCSKIKMPCSRLGERLSPSSLIWRPSPLGLSQCAGPILFVLLTVFYLYHVWVTLLRPHGLWMSQDGKEVLRRQSTRQQLTFPDLFHTGFTHYIKEISLSSYLPSLSPQVFFFLFFLNQELVLE